MNSSGFDSMEFSGFYGNDNRVTEKDVDSSAMDYLELAFMLSEDVPDLSEDEINTAIEKILERTHPSGIQDNSDKTDKNVKVILKALLSAAAFAVISLTCLFAVGTSHNISIENGFVTFAKAAVKTAFFGEEGEENITMDSLMADLELHGFEDVLFPEEFTFNSDIYEVSVPEYGMDDLTEDVSFRISDSQNRFTFTISKVDSLNREASYINAESAETIVLGSVYIYVFEFDGHSTIELCHNGLSYCITSEVPVADMIKIAESIK